MQGISKWAHFRGLVCTSNEALYVAGFTFSSTFLKTSLRDLSVVSSV